MPIIVTWSWALVAILLTAAFAPGFASAIGWAKGVGVAAALVASLFISVFLHEVAHGLIARRFGVEVREYALTFFGGHTAFSGPIGGPGRSALIAAAGPAANAVIAVACWAAWNQVPQGLGGVLLKATAIANAFTGGFNLLPALPLDGGAILEAAIWKATGRRETGSLVAGYTGVAAGIAVCVWAITRANTGATDVIWPVLIGVTIAQGGWASVTRARKLRRLEALSLDGHIMDAVAVPHTATLAEVAPHLAEGRWVVVAEHGRPIGYLDRDAVARASQAALAGGGFISHTADGGGSLAGFGTLDLPVDAAMVAFPAGLGIDADAKGIVLFAAISAVGQASAIVPVIRAGTLIGVVRTADLRG